MTQKKKMKPEKFNQVIPVADISSATLHEHVVGRIQAKPNKNKVSSKIKAKKLATKETPFENRKWQIECFSVLRNKKLGVINAPTGSGKTHVIAMLIWEYLRNNANSKVIITAPQNIITKQFHKSVTFYHPETNGIESLPCPTRIEERMADSNAIRLAEFLGNEDIQDSSKVIIVTHATLLSFYKTYHNNKKIFNNTLLVIDEAHHSSNTDCSNKEIHGYKYIQNQLSRILLFAIKEAENANIILSTATLFRNDGMDIIHAKYRSSFVKYVYELDKYLDDIENPKEIKLSFLLNDANEYYEPIRKLFSKEISPTIIYIPLIRNVNDYSNHDKYEYVQLICNAIAGSTEQNWNENSDGVIVIWSSQHNRYVNVIDLVTEEARESRLQYVLDCENRRDYKVDVIIALQMFLEGANYTPLRRCIVMGMRRSIVAFVQLIGRLLREDKNKNNIEIFQILLISLGANQSKNSFKKNLELFNRALVISMLVEGVLYPVKISVKNSTSNNIEERKYESKTISSRDPLFEIKDGSGNSILNEKQIVGINTQISQQLLSYETVTLSEYKQIFANIMSKHKTKLLLNDSYQIAETKFAQLIAKSKSIEYANKKYDDKQRLESICVDLVQEYRNPVVELYGYFVDLNSNVLRAVADEYNKYTPFTDEELVERIRQYIKENNGRFPSAHSQGIALAGITWSAVNHRLTLRQSSLHAFMVAQGFKENRDPEIKDIDICDAIDRYMADTGELPSAMTKGTAYDGRTWNSIDQYMRKNGSSLYDFKVRYKYTIKTHTINKKQLRKAIEKHFRSYGKYPNSHTKKKAVGDLEYPAVDRRLKLEGSSLSKFMIIHGYKLDTASIDEDVILKDIKAYHQSHDGALPSTSTKEKSKSGFTWSVYDSYLRKSGMTLFSFKVLHGYQNATDEMLDRDVVKSFIKYYKKNGVLPSGRSNEIAFGNLTWRGVDQRLRRKQSSLTLFMECHGYIRHKATTVEKISVEISSYYQKHKEYPMTTTVTEEGVVNYWQNINNYLLKKDSSLKELVKVIKKIDQRQK